LEAGRGRTRHGFVHGVPIVPKGRIIAAFYLTDKIDEANFSDDDST
jgi:hypothetical protein